MKDLGQSSLNEFVIVKNVHIVIDGIMFGIVTWKSLFQAFAPSIIAASLNESGIACRPAM